MMSGLNARCVCLVFVGFLTMSVSAKEVSLVHQGLMLNADLEFAAGSDWEDGVVLITHGALAHRDMEMLVYLRKLLHEAGYNTLAINLSLGLDNRHGMYDCSIAHRHRNDDAIHEIDAWLTWLKKQGVKKVTLLGHSRGGAQTALYAAENNNVLVTALVLLAPATKENTDAAAYQRRYQKPLSSALEKAHQLVEAGKGSTILEDVNLMTCRDTSVAAESFMSYYSEPERVDTPSLIAKINKPILIVVAGDDKVVTGLDRKVAPLMDGNRRQMAIIEGSDHLFRDLNSDDAIDIIDAFLQRVHDRSGDP